MLVLFSSPDEGKLELDTLFCALCSLSSTSPDFVFILRELRSHLLMGEFMDLLKILDLDQKENELQ